MELNITQASTGFRFENRENQKSTAKEILSKQGASEDAIQRVLGKSIYNSSYGRIYSSAQLAILKAATQISVNGSLKETQKYLKNKTSKKNTKEPILGELWDIFSEQEQEYKYILDFEPDFSVVNIFAA